VILNKSKVSVVQTLEHITPYVEKELFFKMNRKKKVVADAGKIKFPGYGFYKGRKDFAQGVYAKAKAKLKAKVRTLTNRKHVPSYEQGKRKLNRFVAG